MGRWGIEQAICLSLCLFLIQLFHPDLVGVPRHLDTVHTLVDEFPRMLLQEPPPILRRGHPFFCLLSHHGRRFFHTLPLAFAQSQSSLLAALTFACD